MNQKTFSLTMVLLGALVLLDNYMRTGAIFEPSQIHHETIALIFFTIAICSIIRRTNINFRSFRKTLGGILLVLSLWLWWESYKMTVIWSKRMELFPMPFYLFHLPHYAVVDLAILLAIIAYIIGTLD